MLHVLGVVFFGSLISLCTSAGSVCDDSAETGKCCVSYYKDSHTGDCLPCVGSFGINCSVRCPAGYFGQKCEDKCNCSKYEVCDLRIGCIVRNDDSDRGHLTRSVLFIVIAICCFVSLVFGIAFYRGRRKRLKRLNYIRTASIDVKPASPCINNTRDDGVEYIKPEMSPLTQHKIPEQIDKQDCSSASTACDRNQWKPWVMLPVRSGVMAHDNGLLQPSDIFKPKSGYQTNSRGTFKDKNQTSVYDKNSRCILNRNMLQGTSEMRPYSSVKNVWK